MHGQDPRTRNGIRSLCLDASLETEIISYNFHPMPAHQRAVADLILEIL